MTLKRPRDPSEATGADARTLATAAQDVAPSKKRRLATTPAVAAAAPSPRADRISALSDELLVRVLAFLDVPQLLGVSLVSRRFARLACDSQLWKALYYARFVLPRAMRIPGFRADRRGAASGGPVAGGGGGVKPTATTQHKLHYAGRRALWADGRRGGIVRDHHGEQQPTDRYWKRPPAAPAVSADGGQEGAGGLEPVDWKRQFRIRHNWSRGKCAVEELRLGDGAAAAAHSDSNADGPDGRPKMLVKVVEGIAVTADAESGLRAWDLKTRDIMAQVSLRPGPDDGHDDGHDGPGGVPSCLAVDDSQTRQDQALKIALGFCDGSFGVWTLRVGRGKDCSVLEPQYRHEPSSNGRLAGMAYSHPFLLSATESILVSLYRFEGSNGEADRLQSGGGPRAKAGRNKWLSPYLLTSLKSHTSAPPLALSVRKAGATTIASIAYTFMTRQGWSIGIQDLHINPPAAAQATNPLDHTSTPAEIGSTRLAYTEPVSTGRIRRRAPRRPRRQPHRTPPGERAPAHSSSGDAPPAPTLRRQSEEEAGDKDDEAQDHNDNDASDDQFDEVGPTALCYTHPYLLATLPDNTLVLHLCTSSASSLTVSPGIRLWGHTSGISDAEITSRGRAVSVSTRGEEMRVWELEGSGRARGGGSNDNTRSLGSSGRRREHGVADAAAGLSVEIRAARNASAAAAWEDRRDWVGFDDEMVIVLKERADGGDSLMVYDFT